MNDNAGLIYTVSLYTQNGVPLRSVLAMARSGKAKLNWYILRDNVIIGDKHLHKNITLIHILYTLDCRSQKSAPITWDAKHSFHCNRDLRTGYNKMMPNRMLKSSRIGEVGRMKVVPVNIYLVSQEEVTRNFYRLPFFFKLRCVGDQANLAHRYGNDG